MTAGFCARLWETTVRKDEIQSLRKNEKRPFILCPFVVMINGFLRRYLTYMSHVIKAGKRRTPGVIPAVLLCGYPKTLI